MHKIIAILRKIIESSWVRTLDTVWPSGMNYRTDSLQFACSAHPSSKTMPHLPFIKKQLDYYDNTCPYKLCLWNCCINLNYILAQMKALMDEASASHQGKKWNIVVIEAQLWDRLTWTQLISGFLILQLYSVSN